MTQPEWEHATELSLPCRSLINPFNINPALKLTTPRKLSKTEQALIQSLVEGGAANAVRTFRTELANEIRSRLQEDVRRATLLSRVLSDRLRLTLAFAQCQLIHSLNDSGQAELLFHSDKPDVSFEKPQVIRLDGPLNAALSQQQHAAGLLPSGVRTSASDGGAPFIATPISTRNAPASDAQDKYLLVLSSPVAFPADTTSKGHRNLSFLDYAMIQELRGLVQTVMTDFRMQQDLSYNYEMAFHGTGRTVDSITGGFAYLMEALYGFDPEQETNAPPVFSVAATHEGADPKFLERVIVANYANALTLANQIHRFELSNPRMYRFSVEVVEKPIKECLSPVLRNLPQMDLVHSSGRSTRVNRVTSAREFPEPILADRRALQIVFSNLVENAIKYRKRGATAEIEISWINSEKFVEFIFRDRGLGIRPGEEASIFHPYYRGTNAKQYAIPGSGLGLTTVRELLKGMSAQIAVESLSDGAAFKVKLPRATPSFTSRPR
ncbi:MAG: ATP-binding protein [Hyphomonadaceae bacterium]|nr:ATP-binding protein [Hyphomonadaceae bacterium]